MKRSVSVIRVVSHPSTLAVFSGLLGAIIGFLLNRASGGNTSQLIWIALIFAFLFSLSLTAWQVYTQEKTSKQWMTMLQEMVFQTYFLTLLADKPEISQFAQHRLGQVLQTLNGDQQVSMCLVAEGKVELNAPVRRYVSELQLKDEQAADRVTVLHLLNHTAGLDWRVNADTGEGDDALARYVAKMAEVELIVPLGARVSYSQVGYNLLGRLIEQVTGQTFEQAVAALVCEPLGLSHSFFARDDIMTRRFTVGHNHGEDATLSIARPWRHSRGDNPGGGMASSLADQLSFARFHLGDGSAENGAQVLPTHVLHQMQEPTAELRASTLGDAIGLCWFLRDVDGVRTVGHAGSANGQFAELLLVPERTFAVVSLSNAGPGGIPFNQAVVRWALEHYLGRIERDPQPITFDAARAREIVGTYENAMMTCTIDTVGTRLRLEIRIKPEIRAAANQELPQDYAPCDFGLLPGDQDESIITDGALKGQRGFFTRDTSGAVVGVDLAGRFFSRVPIVSE